MQMLDASGQIKSRIDYTAYGEAIDWFTVDLDNDGRVGLSAHSILASQFENGPASCCPRWGQNAGSKLLLCTGVSSQRKTPPTHGERR